MAPTPARLISNAIMDFIVCEVADYRVGPPFPYQFVANLDTVSRNPLLQKHKQKQKLYLS